MKHRSSRTFSVALAFVACAVAEGRAQDGFVCPPSTTIGEFCKDRWTFSSIVKFPEARRWIRGKSEYTTDRARLTISCDHDGREEDHRDDRMTMFLWHQSIGTIGLAYSKMLPGAGLIFSMLPFDGSSRSASGTTPGTFAVLNRCELQRRGGHVSGLLFDAGQILPQSFNGVMDKTHPIGQYPKWTLSRLP